MMTLDEMIAEQETRPDLPKAVQRFMIACKKALDGHTTITRIEAMEAVLLARWRLADDDAETARNILDALMLVWLTSEDKAEIATLNNMRKGQSGKWEYPRT